MTDVLAVTAATWGMMMGLAPLLQIRRMVQRRSSADVSLAYLAVLEVGFFLWASYGAAIQNWAIIASNIVAGSVGLLALIVTWHFRTSR
jgi:MtN3 and saliva related transmembrane protein